MFLYAKYMSDLLCQSNKLPTPITPHELCSEVMKQPDSDTKQLDLNQIKVLLFLSVISVEKENLFRL